MLKLLKLKLGLWMVKKLKSKALEELILEISTTPEVIEFLANRNIKRIVYVSCDADTLARDCKLFSNLGYTIGQVDPVDMFPRTGHIENVVCIERI